MDLLAPIINFFIDLLVEIIEFITGILPQTPFRFETLQWGSFGQLIGLVFPIASMATHLTLILVACGLYYAVRLLLRWIKMIQ